MIYLLGILVAVFSLVAAVLHLHQQAAHFWDFVAFACVSGGTIAVALMIFPWQYRRSIFSAIGTLFSPRGIQEADTIQVCMEFFKSISSGARSWDEPARTLSDEILRDGAELLALGFNTEKIHEILEERIYQSFERSQKIANAFRSLSKYPPAFGLAGTVLGLVTLMRKVSAGADAKQTGFMMAIALMATFYGLLTANLLVAPLGENLAKTAVAQRKSAEIALQTIILLANKASLLEAQEVLNSYVAKNERINAISTAAQEAA